MAFMSDVVKVILIEKGQEVKSVGMIHTPEELLAMHAGACHGYHKTRDRLRHLVSGFILRYR
jgi:hypothetical protein